MIPANVMMRFQEIIPQHLVIFAHGADGTSISMGTQGHHNSFDASGLGTKILKAHHERFQVLLGWLDLSRPVFR